jgi:hypothetical protein
VISESKHGTHCIVCTYIINFHVGKSRLYQPNHHTFPQVKVNLFRWNSTDHHRNLLKDPNDFSFPFLLFIIYTSLPYTHQIILHQHYHAQVAVINMPRRSIIFTDYIPARIDPPTFPPRTVPHNPNNDPQITEHSTYSEILATIAPDLPTEDSVEEYDDWIQRFNAKKARIPDDILSVTPSTASLIKKHNKKAKKAGKVDKFKLFRERRDGMSHLPSLRGNSGADDRTAATILSTSHTIGRYSIIHET